MTGERLVAISKLLSLMLRHEPARFDLTLDAEGFAALDDVLRACRSHRAGVSIEDIHAVVETVEPDKRRFTIVDAEIRANYGHSIAQRIRHQAETPPDMLLHGTHQGVIETILREGLSPGARQYVHLTPDRALALRVGARRGRPALIEVDTCRAHRAGVSFYRANESFWLADRVPPEFVRPART